MSLAQQAIRIVTALQRVGHEAYFAGGAVRDFLLGREPQDYDVATNATPDEVARLFPDHLTIGAQFGVVMVKTTDGVVEVTTFRNESGYHDRRRPSDVVWSTAKEDVQRRDFTVNGLLYDPVTSQTLDYVGGRQDLALGLIRTIGDPLARLSEDPLRMLRAIRLKHQLTFQLDKSTFDAIRTLRAEITHVSAERVRDELSQMLDGPWRTEALWDLDECGLLLELLPEIEALKGTPQPPQYHREGDVFAHTLRAVGTLPADAPLFLVWAVLLHDSGKPQTTRYEERAGQPTITTHDHARVSAGIAEAVLRRLKLPKTEIQTVSWLIAHHMSLARIDQMRPARREAYVLDPRFPWLLELLKADASGTTPTDLSLYVADMKLLEKMRAQHGAMQTERPELLVDGHILERELNLQPGPVIGQLLEHIRDAQLAGQIRTTQQAIALARSLLPGG